MKQELLQSLFKLVGQPTPACSSQLCELFLCSGMKPWGGHDLDDTIVAVSLLSFVPATGHATHKSSKESIFDPCQGVCVDMTAGGRRPLETNLQTPQLHVDYK